MAQRREEQYENVMASVFDFVFSTTQKPPSKVKPVKASGIDSSSELVDAVTATLENPLLFVNSETLNSFQDAIDINVAQYKIGGRAGADTFRINLKNIGDIVRDPGAFVDSQFARLEGIRKSQRAIWAGEELKGILGGVWARQQGLDSETQMAMSGAGKISSGVRTVGAEAGHMLARTEKLAKKYLDPSVPALQKSYFVSRYGPGKRANDAYENYLNYRKGYAKDGSGFFNSFRSLGGEGGVSELYTFLEGQELNRKSRDAMNAGDYSKADDLERASYFVEHSFEEQKEKFYRRKQKDTIKKYDQAIETIKSGTGPNKKQKIDALRKKKREIQKNMRYSRFETFAGSLGRIDGAYNSAKQLYFDGQLLPHLITGQFFDDRYNQIRWLQPSRMKEHLVNGKKVGFHGGKDSKYAVKRVYNSGMNAIYYLSPVTWARSLMTGEVFAYAGHLQREAFKLSSKIGKIPGLDIKRLFEDLESGKDTYIKSLKGSLTKSQWARLQAFVLSNQLVGGVAYVFNTPERVKKWIQKQIDEATVKLVREQVGRLLLKIIKDEIAVGLINDWIARGGIKTLIQGLLTTVVAALGVTLTPVVSALIGAAAWVLTEFVYQIAKPLIKFSLELGRVMLYALLGVLFLFISMGSAFVGVFGTHSHVAPQDIIECEAYYDLGLTPLGELPTDEEGMGPNCRVGINVNTSVTPPKGTVVDILNRWVESCPMGAYPDECYDDVVCRALKYGIEPAFAITIWSNESGGSNYANEPNVEDFGIHGHPDVPVADFDKQIEFFLQNIAQPRYIDNCTWDPSYQSPGDLSNEIIMWGAKYWTGGCSNASNLQRGYEYMSQINNIYGWYTGSTLSWPFTVPAQPNACDYSGSSVNTAYHSCNAKGAQGWKAGTPGSPGGGVVDIPTFTPGNLPAGQQCLFSLGPNLRCTQGPYSYCSKDPGYVNHYRPSHINSPAIDVAVGGHFAAPTFCDTGRQNCRVLTTGQATCGGGHPAGGYVIFTAEHEGRRYQFYILHVAIGVNSGQYLSSGQAVAQIVDSEAWRMCSSGLHAHLTVQVNGSYVDAQAAMNQDFQCNIGHCEREQCWPRR